MKTMHPKFPIRVVSATLLGACLVPAQAPVPFPKFDPFEIRFVDFHRDLARPDVVVVVGTLGKHKEGKRVRLPDGKPGDGPLGEPGVTFVPGSRREVEVQAKVEPRVTFAGKADKVVIGFELIVVRLTDGKQQKGSTTKGAPMDEGMAAMFVLAPRAKGDVHDVLHVIWDRDTSRKGAGDEAAFLDSVRDYHAINRRMLDLETALDAVEAAKDDDAKKTSVAALQTLVGDRLQLRRPQNHELLVKHVEPLEQRARERIADDAPKPGK